MDRRAAERVVAAEVSAQGARVLALASPFKATDNAWHLIAILARHIRDLAASLANDGPSPDALRPDDV